VTVIPDSAHGYLIAGRAIILGVLHGRDHIDG
jgi:hypothetical protein